MSICYFSNCHENDLFLSQKESAIKKMSIYLYIGVIGVYKSFCIKKTICFLRKNDMMYAIRDHIKNFFSHHPNILPLSVSFSFTMLFKIF